MEEQKDHAKKRGQAHFPQSTHAPPPHTPPKKHPHASTSAYLAVAAVVRAASVRVDDVRAAHARLARLVDPPRERCTRRGLGQVGPEALIQAPHGLRFHDGGDAVHHSRVPVWCVCVAGGRREGERKWNSARGGHQHPRAASPPPPPPPPPPFFLFSLSFSSFTCGVPRPGHPFGGGPGRSPADTPQSGRPWRTRRPPPAGPPRAAARAGRRRDSPA
jgi:hypothetical protein